MSTSILNVSFRYFPFDVPTQWSIQNFRFDEAKMNLLWLVCPEIDHLHDKKWDGNEVTSSIDAELDRETRELLRTLPPIRFMEIFSNRHEDYLMTEDWPTRYIDTMWRRARAYERRVSGDTSNVVKVDFRKKAA